MQESNPWLELGASAIALTKQQPYLVQKSLKQMSRKIYPQMAQALQELQGEQQDAN